MEKNEIKKALSVIGMIFSDLELLSVTDDRADMVLIHKVKFELAQIECFIKSIDEGIYKVEENDLIDTIDDLIRIEFDAFTKMLEYDQEDIDKARDFVARKRMKDKHNINFGPAYFPQHTKVSTEKEQSAPGAEDENIDTAEINISFNRRNKHLKLETSGSLNNLEINDNTKDEYNFLEYLIIEIRKAAAREYKRFFDLKLEKTQVKKSNE